MSGPISTKLISDISKFSKRKIIDLKQIKEAKRQLEISLKKTNEESPTDLNPLFAVYTDVQHKVVDFYELLSQLPHSQKFCDMHEKAEDIYMPSYPPMSPITNSYFYNWLAFDMGVGLKKETIATVMIDLYRKLGASSDLINLLSFMQESYNGLYVHEGVDNEIVYLREIYTNQKQKVFVPSGYNGNEGEIWLVRLLPSPLPKYVDYKVAFTTPYVLMNIPVAKYGSQNSSSCYPKKDWLEFIERNLFQVKANTPEQRYYKFMKNGLDKHYWLEFVFVSYVNFTNKMILLSGFPDKPETLIHHSQNGELVHGS